MDLPPAQKSHRSRRNESRAATCSREIGPPNSRISPKSRDLSLTNTDRKKGEKGRKGYFESAETAPARDIKRLRIYARINFTPPSSWRRTIPHNFLCVCVWLP